MAATAGQIPPPAQPRQLSLDPGLERQGELFAVPDAAPAARSRRSPDPTSPASDDDALPPMEALAAEGRLHPRRRTSAGGAGTDRAPDPDTTAAASADPTSGDSASGDSPCLDAACGETIARESLDTPAAASPEPSDLPRWHHHSLVDPTLLPPVLRHYVELKAAHPDRVLLYRLGDFFEFFFEDAILLARHLELTLTGKDAGKAVGRVPMAGIPHHAVERYCNDLLRRGLCVALCDQLETTPAKGALLQIGRAHV